MDGVLWNIILEKFIKDNGKMIIRMDKVHKNYKILRFIKEIIKMGYHKVKDYLYGIMDKDIKDLGIMD